MDTGLFISLEGGEGAGKSTAITWLAEYFENKEFEVMTTREPGGIQIAEQIRSVVLDRNNITMDGRTEALLYAAARRQHMVEKVIPALDSGKIVICDRFIDSSLAYQGHARGLGIDEVFQINQFAVNGCMPQLTILMDIDPAIGLSRIQADPNRQIDRLDLETLAFHQKVREGYQILLRKFPERIVMINAEGNTVAVKEQLQTLLANRFNN